MRGASTRLAYTRFMYSSSPAPSSAASTLTLVVLLAIVVLVARSRRITKNVEIQQGQRIRHLAITALDPLVSLVVIGPALWRLLANGGWHIPAALIGGGAGVVIGLQRARVMLVGVRRDLKSVVLQRSGLEYALVGLLVVLRSLEANLNLHHATAASAGVCGLAALGLVEAFVRSGRIMMRYFTEPAPVINQ